MSNLHEYTEWQVDMFCDYCTEVLTHRQFYDNKGICLHCGHLSLTGILPDVTKRSRRKFYTDSRQLAIKAQKLRKSNVAVRTFVFFFSRFRKPKRPFIWEYKDVQY